MFSWRTPIFIASFGMIMVGSGCFLSGGPFEGSGTGGAGASGAGGSSSTTTDGTGAGNDGGTGGAGGNTTTSTGTMTDPPVCTQAGECDDHNPCTEDACKGGKCEHTANDTVVLEDADLVDCKRPVCKDGMVTDEVDKNQSPDVDGRDCTNTYCLEDGTLMSDPDNQGQLCGMQPVSQCQQSICDGGACLVVDLPDGMVVDPGDKDLATGGSDCRDLVCAGGMAVFQPNFLNCSDSVPGNCNVRLCSAQGFCGVLQIAPAGTPCSPAGNGILNGKCDGQGGDFSNCDPP